MSILCVQNRFFGMKEIVGNLVVTDLQKYLQKPLLPITPNDPSITPDANAPVQPISYDFNRIRLSIVDAYHGMFAFYGVHHTIFFHFSCCGRKK